ncbi:MAG: MobF family relaxase, partial [Acidimicrobiales bacterium]
MLRVAKVLAGRDNYYFSTVRATTDLPDGLIEADPYWLGAGVAHLELASPPDQARVRALLAGKSPETGDPLVDRRRFPVDNVAYDIVLSVPKSVSLVHALAAPEAAARIESAHHAAVADAVGFIEREGICARRSRKGEVWEVGVEGAVAVGFLHRTSRANDPHLHTHVLVANLACGQDGQWSSIDGRPLFANQRQARALFEASLRAELTKVGIEFGPMRRDFADIASISHETVREFSRQTRVIEAAMAEEGLRGPAAASLVADGVRPEKDRSRPYADLQAEWRERGYRMGLSENRVNRAAGSGVALAHGPAATGREYS